MNIIRNLKCKLAISLYDIIIIILNVIIVSAKILPAKYSETNGVCSISGCERAAALLISNIDETQRPCDDFYKFACGGFIKSSSIPKDSDYINHASSITDKVYGEIKQSLEEEIDEEQPRIFKLVKNYYRACTKQPSPENEGSKILMKHVETLGGWPVVSGKAWKQRQFDIYKTDYKLRKIGYTPKSLFNIYVFNDVLNTEKNYLYFAPPKTTLTYKVFKRGFSFEIVQAYYNYMIDIAVAFGADKKDAARDMRKVIDLEKALAAAAEIPSGAGSRNLQSIADLEKEAPFLPWLDYVNYVTEPVVHFGKSNVINFVNIGYLVSLDYHLTEFPTKVVANYMIWKMIEESVPYLNEEMRERFFAFQQAISEKSAPLHKKPRWQECIDLITNKDNGLMVGVSSMYIRKYFDLDFDGSTRRNVKQVLASVVDSFKDSLQRATWMDRSSKSAAVRKCDLMRHIIGYPDELLSDETIDDYAKNLELSSVDHFNNFINLQRFHFDHGLSVLTGSSRDSLWTLFSDSTTVNAYYYAPSNAFILLAALLQPPLFDPTWPSYAQYGSVGFIIGHEIMHAYDSKKFKYDEKGSLHPWMSDVSKSEYNKRLICFFDQYNAYKDTTEGLKVNGVQTLDENLSDNGALQIAYYAYKNWTRVHGEDPPLPGLKYTTDQLFWMSSMNFLCGKFTREYRRDMLTSDEHTPDDFRAIGALSNRPEFAKAFGCARGSRMNPTRKCELW